MASTHPTDPIVDVFESLRDRLRAVTYRTLGSHADDKPGASGRGGCPGGGQYAGFAHWPATVLSKPGAAGYLARSADGPRTGAQDPLAPAVGSSTKTGITRSVFVWYPA